MSNIVKLKKGLNINLLGEADKVYASIKSHQLFALKPTEFHNLTPKLSVKPGDRVKAGSVIFYDKYNNNINFCSPVSGEITDVIRGDKRRILEVLIKSDQEIEYESFPVNDSKELSREQIIDHMLKGGVWPFIRQNPYDIIANPLDIPKSIFISAFKSGPLAIDNDFALYGMDELFQIGLDFISKLTIGKVHLNLDGNTNSSKVFTEAKGVKINKFSGPHPVGNVGVQVHHLDPINKGDVVWYLEPQDVISIARLFSQGKYDVSRIIALCGSQVIKARYYRTIAGTAISNFISDNVNGENNRIICGDVLSGTKINENGYLGFYDTQLTIIKEGDQQEFLGWMLPGLNKFSLSKSYFSWLFPKKKYDLDTNMRGEERAYVVTGEYEKVLPMDIYPQQLIKAIMIEDIDLMEKLGLYEVAPEDFALCEFVCTSKIDVQAIIRYGLDLLRKENL
ncbi:MAG: Na(+)-translocating NADH-quinone reductase subunit A [Flavobacteriales bacterium]|nr:Na(+)-translocating NADH-quinone reductase subunit A [Flavobacteriales bacterium]